VSSAVIKVDPVRRKPDLELIATHYVVMMVDVFERYLCAVVLFDAGYDGSWSVCEYVLCESGN
jgi:hypothetical protein